MRKAHVTLRMDPALVEAIEARRVGSRSAWVERAVRAFLAHDEGSAAELATIVRRYRLASQQGSVDLAALDADAARELEKYRLRAMS